MTATTQVTPDTTLYALTQDFAGYTLLDSVLGNQAAGTYAAASEGKSEAQNVDELCGWLETMMRDGAFYTSEADAEQAREQMERGHRYQIEAFTPRSVHAAIMAQAAEDDE